MAQPEAPNPIAPSPTTASRLAGRPDAVGTGVGWGEGLRHIILDFPLFSRYVVHRPLRPYQLEPARAILDSIHHRYGLTFTVMMSRQAGKNELSAQLEAYLLTRFQRRGGSIVKAAPTFRPQIINSILRLQSALDNDLSRGRWTLTLGILEFRRARCFFFSGERNSRVVGATASLLLEIDEAQDFSEEKYLKDFRPMGASTNVTTVLYGTAWTADTRLEHVRRENMRLEAGDGVQRNFVYPWSIVGQHNPSYRSFVAAEIARMGEEHPLVRTQYLLEPLTSAGRFLSETQLAQLAANYGPHPDFGISGAASIPGTPAEGSGLPSTGSGESSIYVAGIDLAGEDEEAEDAVLRSLQPRRDSTAVSLAHVVWVPELGVMQPHIEVVSFYWWTGRKHRELLPQLLDLLRGVWHCTSIVVDATGIGAGVASFLVGALGADIVHPFIFTAVSKSALGYQLLAAINSGRLKVPTSAEWRVLSADRRPAPSPLAGEGWGEGATPSLLLPGEAGPARASGRGTGEGWSLLDDAAARAEFWRQARLARSTLHANQRLTFYVDPREGHDDLLISVALAVEAAQHSRPRTATGRTVRR